jgi:hypothetical protein
MIEVIQARPIDNLVMILHHMTKPGFEANNYEDFEDFVDSVTVRETCAMLI